MKSLVKNQYYMLDQHGPNNLIEMRKTMIKVFTIPILVFVLMRMFA